MGRGWHTSFLHVPVRSAALRNPGYDSRKLSTLKLNRKAKPSLRVRREVTGLEEGDRGLSVMDQNR